VVFPEDLCAAEISKRDMIASTERLNTTHSEQPSLHFFFQETAARSQGAAAAWHQAMALSVE
jgi:hypothetical protein